MTPEESLNRMRLAADNFYYHVATSECYAFIALAGLMREYIKVCEENLARGIDFREPNCPPSQRMQLQPYELDCFEEKLNCIFQGCLEVKRVSDG
jgi:hypothetical protein